MHLIYATDLSVEALAGAYLWKTLVQGFDNHEESLQLDVLHVVEPPTFGGPALKDPSDTRRVEKRVQRWLNENIEHPPDAQIVVREGKPKTVINDYATECGADFLVMGQTGKGRFTRMLLGSTAHGVAQTPPCRLLIAHREFTSMGHPRKFVVGVDFDETSERALRSTAWLARRFDASLEVVHVVESPPPAAFPGGVGGYPPQEGAIEQQIREARTEMKAFLRRCDVDLEDLQVATEVMSGSATHQLVEHAISRSADLLVVGTIAHGAVGRTVLGSVAGGVVRHMGCNTMLVPPFDAS